MSTEPYEVVVGPVEVYISPVGTAMPAVTLEPPASPWVLIGTLGNREIGEDGVSLAHEESIEDFRGLGSTGILKSMRTEEGIVISFMLNDITLAEYSRALNLNAKTTDGSDDVIDLYKGVDVATRALLVRGNGLGPNGASKNIQFELPRVRPDAAPDVVFVKGTPAGLALSFRVMDDLNAASSADRHGLIRTET
ncbi:hypothetical protein LCGC14_0746900 [marine sediment metagenome]|uniref:Uncharacterized protein n=1 Tax=marine sediment metagenome TaxID=412755 RepID=A0A0F9Q9B5_9ZZZZ